MALGFLFGADSGGEEPLPKFEQEFTYTPLTESGINSRTGKVKITLIA